MAFKIRHAGRAVFYAALVAYPGLVFYLLVIREVPLRMLSLFVMGIAILAFIARTSKKKQVPFPFYGLPSCYSV